MPDNFLDDFGRIKKINNSNRQSLIEEKAEKLRVNLQAKKLVEREQRSIENKRRLDAIKNAIANQSLMTSLRLGEQQAQKRQGVIRSIGSKAEKLEIWAVTRNEVPMLMNMEKARQDVLTPPDKWLENVERSVTDSFPD
jgi:hypothetical protein